MFQIIFNSNVKLFKYLLQKPNVKKGNYFSISVAAHKRFRHKYKSVNIEQIYIWLKGRKGKMKEGID